jgi:hypothetical protein
MTQMTQMTQMREAFLSCLSQSRSGGASIVLGMAFHLFDYFGSRADRSLHLL